MKKTKLKKISKKNSRNKLILKQISTAEFINLVLKASDEFGGGHSTGRCA